MAAGEQLKRVKNKLSTIQYNKLVRDRIPEIIEASGKRCVCSTLSDEEYLAKLDEKLNEELAEYQESKSMEELADLLEVIRAVASLLLTGIRINHFMPLFRIDPIKIILLGSRRNIY